MRNNRYPDITRTMLVAGLACVLAGVLAGCASRPAFKTSALRPSNWHLPWHRAAAPAPVPVQELGVHSEADVSGVRQYWARNTLRIDVTALSGSGTLQLQPNAVNGWPARLEFAVRAGGIAQLEILGEQRVVFPVSATTADGAPQVLALAPSAWSPATRQLTVSWR